MSHRRASITLDNVTLIYKMRTGLFSYEEKTVLKEISFCLFNGEVLGVIGRNGSGKSSLLRLLANIILPTSGNVLFQKEMRSSLLTLGLGFSLDLTGRENSCLSLMLQGFSEKEALIASQQINEYAGLGDYFDRQVKTYSAGMRSRLGFATSISNTSSILLIDEILGVGDLAFRSKAHRTILDTLKGKQSAVIVSHNLNQLSSICDRALWLENGSIRSLDVTDKVLMEYKKLL